MQSRLRNGVFSGVSSAVECQLKCTHRLSCRAWEYNNSNCVLYDADPVCQKPDDQCLHHSNGLQDLKLATRACGFLKAWHVIENHGCSGIPVTGVVTNKINSSSWCATTCSYYFPHVWHGVLENLLILVVVSTNQFHPSVFAACLIMDTIIYPKP